MGKGMTVAEFRNQTTQEQRNAIYNASAYGDSTQVQQAVNAAGLGKGSSDTASPTTQTGSGVKSGKTASEHYAGTNYSASPSKQYANAAYGTVTEALSKPSNAYLANLVKENPNYVANTLYQQWLSSNATADTATKNATRSAYFSAAQQYQAEHSTAPSASQSTVAYDSNGNVDATGTLLNVINDAKAINNAANAAKPTGNTKGSEDYDAAVLNVYKHLGGKTLLGKVLNENLYQQAVETVNDSGFWKDNTKQAILPSRFGNLTANSIMARAEAKAGNATSNLYGSRTGKNYLDYYNDYADEGYASKLWSNVGNTVFNYANNIVNFELTGLNAITGGKIQNSSVFNIANFLQNATSGVSGLKSSALRDNTSFIGRLILDLEQTTIEQGLDRAFAAVTGIPAGSLGIMGVRVFGAGAQEAENAGKGIDQQVLSGVVQAGIEVATELAGGVGGSWRGRGYIDSVFDVLDDFVSTKTGSELVGTLARAFGSEAVEEMTSDVLNPIVSWALGLSDDVTDFKSLLLAIWDNGNLLYDGLLGGLAGMFGGAQVSLQQSRASRQIGVDVAIYKAAQSIVEDKKLRAKFEFKTGIKLSSDSEAATAQVAAAIANDIVDGETTAREVRDAITSYGTTGSSEGYNNIFGNILANMGEAETVEADTFAKQGQKPQQKPRQKQTLTPEQRAQAKQHADALATQQAEYDGKLQKNEEAIRKIDEERAKYQPKDAQQNSESSFDSLFGIEDDVQQPTGKYGVNVSPEVERQLDNIDELAHKYRAAQQAYFDASEAEKDAAREAREQAEANLLTAIKNYSPEVYEYLTEETEDDDSLFQTPLEDWEFGRNDSIVRFAHLQSHAPVKAAPTPEESNPLYDTATEKQHEEEAKKRLGELDEQRKALVDERTQLEAERTRIAEELSKYEEPVEEEDVEENEEQENGEVKPPVKETQQPPAPAPKSVAERERSEYAKGTYGNSESDLSAELALSEYAKSVKNDDGLTWEEYLLDSRADINADVLYKRWKLGVTEPTIAEAQAEENKRKHEDELARKHEEAETAHQKRIDEGKKAREELEQKKNSEEQEKRVEAQKRTEAPEATKKSGVDLLVEEVTKKPVEAKESKEGKTTPPKQQEAKKAGSEKLNKQENESKPKTDVDHLIEAASKTAKAKRKGQSKAEKVREARLNLEGDRNSHLLLDAQVRYNELMEGKPSDYKLTPKEYAEVLSLIKNPLSENTVSLHINDMGKSSALTFAEMLEASAREYEANGDRGTHGRMRCAVDLERWINDIAENKNFESELRGKGKRVFENELAEYLKDFNGYYDNVDWEGLVWELTGRMNDHELATQLREFIFFGRYLRGHQDSDIKTAVKEISKVLDFFKKPTTENVPPKYRSGSTAPAHTEGSEPATHETRPDESKDAAEPSDEPTADSSATEETAEDDYLSALLQSEAPPEMDAVDYLTEAVDTEQQAESKSTEKVKSQETKKETKSEQPSDALAKMVIEEKAKQKSKKPSKKKATDVTSETNNGYLNSLVAEAERALQAEEVQDAENKKKHQNRADKRAKAIDMFASLKTALKNVFANAQTAMYEVNKPVTDFTAKSGKVYSPEDCWRIIAINRNVKGGIINQQSVYMDLPNVLDGKRAPKNATGDNVRKIEGVNYYKKGLILFNDVEPMLRIPTFLEDAKEFMLQRGKQRTAVTQNTVSVLENLFEHSLAEGTIGKGGLTWREYLKYATENGNSMAAEADVSKKGDNIMGGKILFEFLKGKSANAFNFRLELTRQFYYRKALYNDWLSGVDKAALKALPQRDTETSNLYNIDSAIEQGIYSKAEIQAMRDFNEFARKAEHVDTTYDSIVQSATETRESKAEAETKPKAEAAKETKNGVDYLVENVKPKTKAKTEAKPKAETKPRAKVEKEKAPEKPFTDEEKDAKIEPEVKYEPREPKVGRLTKEVKEGRAGGNYARTEGDLWLEGAKRVDIIDELSLEMAHEKDPEAAKKLEQELLYWLKEYCSKYDYERLTDKWKGQMSNFEAWKVFSGPYSKFGLASDENLYSGIRSKIKEQKGETNEQKGKAERESKTASGERTSEILPDRGNDSKNAGGRATGRGVDRAKEKSGEASSSSMATLSDREVASPQHLINAWGEYIGPKCDVDLSPGEVRYPELADAPSTRVSFKEYGDLDVIQEDSWPQDFRNLADEAMHQFDDYPPKYRPQVFLVKGKGGQGWAAFFQPESFQYDHTNSGAIVIPAEAPSSLRHLIMHESGHALSYGIPWMRSVFADVFLNVFGAKRFKSITFGFSKAWGECYGQPGKTSNFIYYVGEILAELNAAEAPSSYARSLSEYLSDSEIESAKAMWKLLKGEAEHFWREFENVKSAGGFWGFDDYLFIKCKGHNIWERILKQWCEDTGKFYADYIHALHGKRINWYEDKNFNEDLTMFSTKNAGNVNSGYFVDKASKMFLDGKSNTEIYEETGLYVSDRGEVYNPDTREILRSIYDGSAGYEQTKNAQAKANEESKDDAEHEAQLWKDMQNTFGKENQARIFKATDHTVKGQLFMETAEFMKNVVDQEAVKKYVAEFKKMFGDLGVGKVTIKEFCKYYKSLKGHSILGDFYDEQIAQGFQEIVDKIEAATLYHSYEVSDDVTELIERTSRYFDQVGEAWNSLDALTRAAIQNGNAPSETGRNPKTKERVKHAAQTLANKFAMYQIQPLQFFRRIDGWKRSAKGEGYKIADEIQSAAVTKQKLSVQAQSFFKDVMTDEKAYKAFATGKTKSGIKLDCEQMTKDGKKPAYKVKVEHELSMDEVVSLFMTLRSLRGPKARRLSGVGIKDGDKAPLMFRLSYDSKDKTVHNAGRLELQLLDAIKNDPVAKAYIGAFDNAAKFIKPYAKSASTSISGVDVFMMKDGMYFPVSYYNVDGKDHAVTEISPLTDIRYMHKRTRDFGGFASVKGVVEVTQNYIESMSNYIAYGELANKLNLMRSLRTFGVQNLVDTINANFGSDMGAWLSNYIDDINNMAPQKARGKDNFFGTLTRNFQTAVLVGNIGTPLKQHGTLWNSMSELDPRAVMKAAVTSLAPGNKIIKDAKSNNILLQYRGMGNVDPTIADALNDEKTIFGRLSAKSKLLQRVASWIPKADVAEVSKVYLASYYDVILKNSNVDQSSARFQRLVDQTFERALFGSQAQYDMNLRDAIARGGSNLLKGITMFQTQQRTVANQLWEAMAEQRANPKSAEAKAKLQGTVTGWVASNVAYGVMSLIGRLVRHKLYDLRDDDDDDDKRLTLEKFLQQISFETIKAMAGTFIFGEDAASVLLSVITKGEESYYASDVPVLETLASIGEGIVDLASNDGTAIQNADAVRKLGGEIANLFGIPLNNAYTSLNAMLMWSCDIVNALKRNEDKSIAGFFAELAKGSSIRDFTTEDRADFFKMSDDPVDDILKTLAKLDKAVLSYAGTVSIDDGEGNKITLTLTNDERRQYAETAKETYDDAVSRLLSNGTYKLLDDESKENVLEQVKEYSKGVAREEIAQGQGYDWDYEPYDDLQAQNNVLDYYVLNEAISEDNYSAVDYLLKNYTSIPKAVVDKAKNNTNLHYKDMLYANLLGIKSEEWDKTYEAVKAATTKNNTDNAKAMATYNYLAGRGFSDDYIFTAIKTMVKPESGGDTSSVVRRIEAYNNTIAEKKGTADLGSFLELIALTTDYSQQTNGDSAMSKEEMKYIWNGKGLSDYDTYAGLTFDEFYAVCKYSKSRAVDERYATQVDEVYASIDPAEEKEYNPLIDILGF